MEKVEYFVKCINDENLDVWKCRYFKRINAPLWEKLNPQKDNISEIIRTHRYKYDTYPDNDCTHGIIEYTVEIKKVITVITTEYL